jgi:hypothetical protein
MHIPGHYIEYRISANILTNDTPSHSQLANPDMAAYLFLVSNLALERIFDSCFLLCCALLYGNDKTGGYMRHA